MYQPSRPLGFFVPDNEDSSRGSVVEGFGNFAPGNEYKAVVGLKQRKVIILSPDELNHDQHRDQILVAPMYSLDEEDKKEPWYPLLENNTHPLWAFIPEEVTGVPCYVDLTRAFPIKKNMLLSKKMLVPGKYMDRIEEIFEYCAGLGLRVEKSKDEGGSNN